MGIQECVMYDLLPLIPDGITNAVKMAAYEKAIAAYGNRWPAQMVRNYVDATIRKLYHMHAEAELLRRKPVPHKYRNSGRPRRLGPKARYEAEQQRRALIRAEREARMKGRG